MRRGKFPTLRALHQATSCRTRNAHVRTRGLHARETHNTEMPIGSAERRGSTMHACMQGLGASIQAIRPRRGLTRTARAHLQVIRLRPSLLSPHPSACKLRQPSSSNFTRAVWYVCLIKPPSPIYFCLLSGLVNRKRLSCVAKVHPPSGYFLRKKGCIFPRPTRHLSPQLFPLLPSVLLRAAWSYVTRECACVRRASERHYMRRWKGARACARWPAWRAPAFVSALARLFIAHSRSLALRAQRAQPTHPLLSSAHNAAKASPLGQEEHRT